MYMFSKVLLNSHDKYQTQESIFSRYSETKKVKL